MRPRPHPGSIGLLLLAAACTAPRHADAARLELLEGAHVCIIGGGVADAM